MDVCGEFLSLTVPGLAEGRPSLLLGDKIVASLTYKFRLASCIERALSNIIIHQSHYENSDWSRAFNQFTIACELDMINTISAADIAFVMSSSTSAWLLSPFECSPQKQNG